MITPSRLKRAVVSFFKDGCLNDAGAIAYFAVLSSLPLLFLICTMIAMFAGSRLTVSKEMYDLIVSFVPNLSYPMYQKLTGWFTKTSYGLNVASIAVLVFSGTSIFSAIEKSLMDIFQDFDIRRRSSLESFLVALALVAALAVMSAVFMTADTLFVFLRKSVAHSPELAFMSPYLRRMNVLLSVVPLVMQVLVVALLFKVFLREHVRLRHVFGVSVFISVMWSLAMRLFSWYVTTVPSINVIYGSMSVFIIFITWTYYAALIFLFGAELLKVRIDELSRKEGT